MEPSSGWVSWSSTQHLSHTRKKIFHQETQRVFAPQTDCVGQLLDICVAWLQQKIQQVSLIWLDSSQGLSKNGDILFCHWQKQLLIFMYHTNTESPIFYMKVEKVLGSFDSGDMIRKKVWILMNGSRYFEGTTPSAMSRLIHLRMLIVMFSIRLINCLPVINKREKNLKQLLNRKYFCRLAS